MQLCDKNDCITQKNHNLSGQTGIEKENNTPRKEIIFMFGKIASLKQINVYK